MNLETHDVEVVQLKEECKAIKHELKKCQDHLELKEKVLVIQDNRIIQLENTIDKLKSRIQELSKSNWVEAYIDRNTSFNPKNTLNGIRILLTTAHEFMQRNAQDTINMQDLYRIANDRINGLRNDLTTTRNQSQDKQTNGQRMTLRKQNQINVLVEEKAILQLINQRCKAEADLAEFNQIFAIFAKYEQYTGQEPPDKYLDKVWNSIVSHLDGSMTALETANAGDFDNVIKCGLLKTKLREKYIPVPANNPYTANNPPINLPDTLQTWMRAKYQRENIARDLVYTRIGIDDATLENFIYEELKKRLGVQTAHVRKSPFTLRSAYVMKKIVRKVVQKAKQTRNCSACGKAGHIKVNCPRLKWTKKVNYVYQNEEEDSEDSEDSEEYILEEKDLEKEIKEDDEYINDDIDNEPQNCYALKKKVVQSGVPIKKSIKKSPTSKSRTSNIDIAVNYMFQIALKSSIASLVPYYHCLNTGMPNDTIKRRELAWGIIVSKFEDILFPLLQAVNSEQKPFLQVPDNNESIPNASNLKEDMVIADSTKIKEIYTTSSSYAKPESIRLDHAIKAYASAQKKIAKYIGQSLWK
ncbi:hypothetical protein RclHR1_16510005 [Rhizophagus clarus]|uniref:CCHC-type domain-containing protein n=1 Tax=Rhizophagus clarus TaxID=94130 RepID=A0A2Z6RAI8_9GLOM|nr:hypothetical protein RclHR1_16510005 [Rhizophagus clarus]